MAGTVSRSHSGDRFYNPPAMRRHRQLMLQKQQEQLQKQQEQVQRPEKSPPPPAAVVESENRIGYNDSAVTLSNVPSVSDSSTLTPSTGRSNLDNLVESVSLIVPAQYCPEVNVRGRGSREARKQPFYCLGDLWESLREWSAYGAGVPLLLNGTDSIKQYYVPYLSGMQLYIDPQNPPSNLRKPGEESDTDSSIETCGRACDDFEADKQTNSVKDGIRSRQNWVNLNSQQLNSLSYRDKSLNSSSGNEGEVSVSLGELVFEFFEREQPYIRKPLADKISVLESQFPKLSLYRSCDLSPRSWISIAWYPIYRIPMGSTLKDLDASFLTIHPLSTQNSSQPQLRGASGGLKVNGVSYASSKFSLPVTGLASYKYKGSILSPCGPQECEKENALLQAASDWLQGLNVVLPDFQFFRSHYSSWRR